MKKKTKLFSSHLLPLAVTTATVMQFTMPEASATIYYWDNNGTTSGFGTAGGTWADTGSTLWNNDSAGGGAGAPNILGTTITTTSSDQVNFGTATAGLLAGTVTVSGTVNIGNTNPVGTTPGTGITFGAASGAIELSGGTINMNATGCITVLNTSNTISSKITGAATSLITSGTGKIILSGANTFAGTLQIDNGTVSVASISSSFSSDQALGKGAVIQLGSTTNGTLEYTGSGNSTTDKQIRIGRANNSGNTGGAIILNNGNGSLTFTNGTFNALVTAQTITRTLTLGGSYSGANGVNEIQGTIRNGLVSGGTNALTVSGSSWKLSGTNTFTGLVTVSGGTLIMANTQALGLGVGNNSIGGGTLVYATGGSDTVYNFTNGSGTVANIVSDVASGTVGINHTLGNYFIGGSTTAGVTQLNVTKGAGILSGSPSITIGALSMSSGTASPLISTLNPTTANLIIGTVTNANGSATNTRTLNLDGTSTGNEITGAISNGPTATTLVTKTNNSTWTLSGDSSYTGATTVSGGKLIINGSTSSTSIVTVNNGATLGGSGTVGGATTVYGIHSPGNSPGIQTFGGDLTYDGGLSVVNWELNGNTSTNAANPNAIFDQIIVGGNLNFADDTTLNLSFIAAGSNVLWSDTFWATNQSWTLFDVTGTTTNLTNLTLSTINWLDSGSNAFNTVRSGSSFTLSQSGNDVMLNYIVVPEPRAALLGGVGLLMLLRRRR